MTKFAQLASSNVMMSAELYIQRYILTEQSDCGTHRKLTQVGEEAMLRKPSLAARDSHSAHSTQHLVLYG